MLKALEILNETRKLICNQTNIEADFIDEAILELESLENRSCENCKYFYNQDSGFGLCNKGVASDFKIGTFYCNKWQSKN